MGKQSEVLLVGPGPLLDLGVQKAGIMFPALLRMAIYLFRIGVLGVELFGNELPLVPRLGVLPKSQDVYFSS